MAHECYYMCWAPINRDTIGHKQKQLLLDRIITLEFLVV